ncbi:hypothetical protein ABL78_2307 [Leptomonas seymouri]|uniref:Uncharacterized protein n=1 Tax=Leptomonas seymouri TaxID=5684 RepID=A0A0N1I108_LEPSE|nr:hypothetical protein ABL78_2307 [Leptomonas seymouri]|eukprot:KPI88574.1 hypothetical protein ABL78_2307 [Leptomonas seymouri]
MATPPTSLPSHPALVSLHAALDAVGHLEECFHSLKAGDASTAQPPSAPPTFLSASLFSAKEYEHDWEVLTAQLRLLVDETHPNREQPTSKAVDVDTETTKCSNAFRDGRAVLLEWNATRCSSPVTSASSAPLPQQYHSGDLTRLFSFLQHLAESFLTTHQFFSSNPTVAAPSLSGSATGSNTAISAAVLPADRKAQLLAEDIAEPVFIYGCAVASNLASLASGGKREKRQPNCENSGGVDTAGAVLGRTPTSDEEQEARNVVLGSTVWAFVVAVTRLCRAEKRMLHLLLSVLSNVMRWPALRIDSDTCAFLYQLILPFYTSHLMVDAWVTLLCNLTAAHGAATVPTLLRLGVVADVERLCLAVPPSESATTERLVTHSVQLLSNIAMCVFKDEKHGT